MGCFGSKGKAFKARLEAAEAQVSAAAWRDADGQVCDFQLLEESITELQALHMMSTGNDAKRVKLLANRVEHDLVGMLDIRLLRRNDFVAVRNLLQLARELESAGVENACARVDAKHKECLKELGTSRFQEAEIRMRRVVQPEMLPDSSDRVLSILKEIHVNIAEVPALVPGFLQCSRVLREKILELLGALISFDVRKLLVIRKVAVDLDKVCSELTRPTDEPWELLLPVVQKIGRDKASELLPEKLKSLESEVRTGKEKRSLISCLEGIAPLWIAPSLTDMARVDNALSSIETQITEDFDSAIKRGGKSDMDNLVELADQFDRECSVMQESLENEGSRKPRESLAVSLKRKRAGIQLKDLLANADDTISKHTKSLEEANKVAWKAIKAVSHDKLDARAGQPQWSFKLNRGDFKNYDDDKTKEVEGRYQAWIRGGKLTQGAERVEIVMPVEMKKARRRRCQYGDGCYRKSVEHRREFAHPGDDDWADALPPSGKDLAGGDGTGSTKTSKEEPTSSEGVAISEERFCLDFNLMTQMRLTGGRAGGRRLIKRNEGMTYVQVHTHKYYEGVIELVKQLENLFSEAEVELRVLGEEGKFIQKQVDGLLEAVKGPLSRFVELAVHCKDKDSMDAINQVQALLGVHSERLGINAALKDSELNEIIEALQKAYAVPEPVAAARSKDRKWALVRKLCKHNPKGSMLLTCRLALVKAKKDRMTAARDHLHMRCQGLLMTYASDKDFGVQFRKRAMVVLTTAARHAADENQIEVVHNILRTAVSWQCNVTPIEKVAGDVILHLLQTACKREAKPSARLVEVLQLGHTISQVSSSDEKRTLQKLCDITPELGMIAGKVVGEIQMAIDDPRAMPASVKQVVELRKNLYDAALVSAFDEKFWGSLEPVYKKATTTRITEWAIAYCEQLKVKIPSWMMNKDQVEALNKLQAAVDSKDEQKIREAVVFARQTDYTADDKLRDLYEKSVTELKLLKRLPAGWEVEELVGVDAKSKMFKKVNMDGENIKKLFQKALSDTKKGIITRDRRDGAVPRGYQVEQIISVMNVESWGLYNKRLDLVKEDCKKFPDSAPCTESVWTDWGGKIETQDISNEILKSTMLPELAPKGNEFLLFHGTNPKAADSIAQNNFDMAFACKTGLFGAGLYFAESSTKSDEYVKPDGDDRYPVIICRVTLGHINHCESADPIKDPGRDKLESSCIGGDFHSVLGNRKKARGTYREFIVYDPHQVYPHFIVWYKRL
mmetsp:Transcript_52487/g.122066  ORF Transcript_52487/g.122066 Transcript_52487/m.122066 type:complete len:1243 (-) Transcript_52487:113-3841(-)